MKVDFDSPIPLYFQIQQQLREKILDGTYAYGKEVPTEMELCEMFGVSPVYCASGAGRPGEGKSDPAEKAQGHHRHL